MASAFTMLQSDVMEPAERQVPFFMKYYITILFTCLTFMVKAQELFVFTEPASNMAAKSVGLRLNNFLMKKINTSSYSSYQLTPEVMIGVSKKIMLHGDVFFSNMHTGFGFRGGSVYAKYRFFSNDDVQKHFRMAAYGRISFVNMPVHQEDISLYGMNSGYEGGLIITQLLHKVALSAGSSFVKATSNGSYKFPNANDKAVNYTFSLGKLMLPKDYTNYKQTNLNLMLEMLGQTNIVSRGYYIDIAPSLQLIVNSQSRLDFGYRHQLSTNMFRFSANSFLIRLEHNLYNVF